jgi:peptidoglycan/LPS O-acetylase OafA/YrhL
MFGLLRLCLALLVMYSHLGATIAGRNPGVAAVVVFFLLAGRVSAHLLESFGNQAFAYHAERLMRILPSYFCALLFAAAVWVAAPVASPFFPPPDRMDWIANLFIIPLDFRLKCGNDCLHLVFASQAFTLIPPAWSLGLELQFYIVAPMLMIASAARRAGILAASLFIWGLAGMGVLDTDTWGYRLLPGTVFIFLAGMEMHHGRHERLAAVWLAAALMCGAIFSSLVAPRPFNIETSLGLIIGIPVLYGLCFLPRCGFDSFLGGLSYPVFLLHFPVMWLMEGAGYKPASGAAQFVLLGGVLCASALVYLYIDRPLEPFRTAFRDRFGAPVAERG